VSGCCVPRGYEKIFGEKTARRDAKNYRHKGLGDTSKRVVALAGRPRTVLEIGGGVGAIQLELLKGGAERATNVELSKGYEAEAAALAREAGVADRVERRLGDVAVDGAEIGPAEAVIMNRVVCCYPDVDALVGAAALRAENRLVLCFPRDSVIFRAAARLVNLGLRLVDFRVYVHRERRIVAAATAEGLRPAAREQGRIWVVLALERG
jgi:magnesium-protoporphyrin O-methyltransferase